MHDCMMKGAMAGDPDAAFAEAMTAHHEGAIKMAKTQLKYGKDPEMRKLAEDIIKAQQPEIDQIQTWLKGKVKNDLLPQAPACGAYYLLLSLVIANIPAIRTTPRNKTMDIIKINRRRATGKMRLIPY